MFQVSEIETNNLSNPKHLPVAGGGRQEDIANVLIADNDSELARFMLEILARKGATLYLPVTE